MPLVELFPYMWASAGHPSRRPAHFKRRLDSRGDSARECLDHRLRYAELHEAVDYLELIKHCPREQFQFTRLSIGAVSGSGRIADRDSFVAGQIAALLVCRHTAKPIAFVARETALVPHARGCAIGHWGSAARTRVSSPLTGQYEVVYVRFEAAEMNSHGFAPGVFALANGLAHTGALSDDDYAWWRANNDWMNRAYTDPGGVDATLFDREIHPHAQCWFKLSRDAEHLLLRTRRYLDLLDRYGVSWTERRSSAPGPIIYEDDYQIVVNAVKNGAQAGRR